jgi:hypothetical protein
VKRWLFGKIQQDPRGKLRDHRTETDQHILGFHATPTGDFSQHGNDLLRFQLVECHQIIVLSGSPPSRVPLVVRKIQPCLVNLIRQSIHGFTTGVVALLLVLE